MIRSLFLAATLASGCCWAAATYSFASGTSGTVTTFTSCAAGPCANYSTSMRISGSFTLAAAPGPNFSGATDISSQVIGYSFSDGITTYAKTDPNTRIYQFSVVTDASGNITIAHPHRALAQRFVAACRRRPCFALQSERPLD